MTECSSIQTPVSTRLIFRASLFSYSAPAAPTDAEVPIRLAAVMGDPPSTRKGLRVLLVEDSEADADLVIASLEHGGYDVAYDRVQTAGEMREALGRDGWQVILSDYTLPTFSAPEALAIAQELHPEIPFIIVSGTVGEDTAVAALKAGASDFLVKGRLIRLVPAIERELREAALGRERAREKEALEERLRQAHQRHLRRRSRLRQRTLCPVGHPRPTRHRNSQQADHR